MGLQKQIQQARLANEERAREERAAVRAFVGKPDADGVYRMTCEGREYTATRVDRAGLEAQRPNGVTFRGVSYGYVVRGPNVSRDNSTSLDLADVVRTVRRAAGHEEREAQRLEERRASERASERAAEELRLRSELVTAALAWLNAGIYRHETSGGLLDAAYALHTHETGEKPQQAIDRWARERAAERETY